MCKFAFLTAANADAARTDSKGSVFVPPTSGGRLVRGKDYNAGLRGVLFEARHYERMGAAVWLYGWLVLRQTHQQGDVGWVLGGAPISYREIQDETGFNVRTLERWMHTLRRERYIDTEAAPAGIIVRIMKAKKFPQGARRNADGVRGIAGGATHIRGAKESHRMWNHQPAPGIGSSSVVRSQERSTPVNTSTDFHGEVQNRKPQDGSPHSTPSGLGQLQNLNQNPETDFPSGPHTQQQNRFFLEARLRQQLLRAEREEAVRRELAVGSGPEVPGS
jgi:hypothetical protein